VESDIIDSEKSTSESNYLAELTVRLISDQWKVLIIQNLMEGTKRFGELKRDLGTITQKVLTSNLKTMEKNGLLMRKVYAQIPPKVEYSLTSLGYSLKPVLDSMAQWAEEYTKSMKINVQSLGLSFLNPQENTAKA
jgi:DNA-binding HxlR family transcriptional regulator